MVDIRNQTRANRIQVRFVNCSQMHQQQPTHWYLLILTVTLARGGNNGPVVGFFFERRWSAVDDKGQTLAGGRGKKGIFFLLFDKSESNFCGSKLGGNWMNLSFTGVFVSVSILAGFCTCSLCECIWPRVCFNVCVLSR